jgi:hypothetical protein
MTVTDIQVALIRSQYLDTPVQPHDLTEWECLMRGLPYPSPAPYPGVTIPQQLTPEHCDTCAGMQQPRERAVACRACVALGSRGLKGESTWNKCGVCDRCRPVTPHSTGRHLPEARIA